jgi:hypothetical protein
MALKLIAEEGPMILGKVASKSWVKNHGGSLPS